MIRNRHRLESDLLGVLEVGVRPPDLIEPLDGQQLVLPAPPDSYQPQHVLSDVSIVFLFLVRLKLLRLIIVLFLDILEGSLSL